MQNFRILANLGSAAGWGWVLLGQDPRRQVFLRRGPCGMPIGPMVTYS